MFLKISSLNRQSIKNHASIRGWKKIVFSQDVTISITFPWLELGRIQIHQVLFCVISNSTSLNHFNWEQTSHNDTSAIVKSTGVSWLFLPLDKFYRQDVNSRPPLLPVHPPLQQTYQSGDGIHRPKLTLDAVCECDRLCMNEWLLAPVKVGDVEDKGKCSLWTQKHYCSMTGFSLLAFH